MDQNSATPKPLKMLLLITAGAFAAIALLQGAFPNLPIEAFFSLSLGGVKKLFVWQLFSYFFVLPAPEGITFSFLIKGAFHIYLLWLVGNSILQRRRALHFFAIYFACGIGAGFFALALMALFSPFEMIAGNSTALYGLLTAWITLNPGAKVLFFFTFPVRAKNLILTLLTANFLIELSTGSWVLAAAYASASFIGYFYASQLADKKTSPAYSASYSRAKIYDFKTGNAILTDEEFLEEMLTKISMKGKKSLTFGERWRLRRINKKKKR